MSGRVVLAAFAALGLATSASATTVLFEDFNALTPALSVTSLPGFAVTGTVDIVGPSNPYGIVVSSTVIDIDGTPGPGRLTSLSTYNFAAGEAVDLGFILGGAQRGSAGDDFSVDLIFGQATAMSIFGGTGYFSFVNFGGPITLAPTFTATYNGLLGSDPFKASSLFFTPVNAGSFQFSLSSTSADNVGPLLDSVTLSIGAVPEPASWAMMITGFGLVGAAMRRRRIVATA